ncbi:hypothetical protein SDC9_184445 [bioreactor metagenome]|uniref:Uncharacterized protein n=1 Tax=bioreactor metagenome TaxID=1076179 RepID=A0A645HNA9_9ZZZZ
MTVMPTFVCIRSDSKREALNLSIKKLDDTTSITSSLEGMLEFKYVLFLEFCTFNMNN